MFHFCSKGGVFGKKTSYYSAGRKRLRGLTISTPQCMRHFRARRCDAGTNSGRASSRGPIKRERVKGPRLACGIRNWGTGNFSLRVFEKDTRYSTSGLFRPVGMCSVHQTAAEDTETPTTKVIFLDAPGRVTEARSGNVSEWTAG